MKGSARFGVEEEFLLLEAQSGLPVPAPIGLLNICRQQLGSAFTRELFACQVEISSPVFCSLDEAATYLQKARRSLYEIASRFNLTVYAAGSHPLALSSGQPITPINHYRQLIKTHGHLAARSLLNGLHVHVGVDPHQDRMHLIHRILPWTPLLLALSASSPFWEGQPSGVASYRRAASGEWPRMGMPEDLPDQATYDDYVRRLLDAEMIETPHDIWWFIRPSSQYPTLELRIADGCPRLQDALCIAGLFRALVAWAQGSTDCLANRWLRADTAENYWQAQRLGCGGRFRVNESVLDVQQWLELLITTTERYLDQDTVLRAKNIVRNGCSARRQLEVWQAALARGESHEQALRAVTKQVVEDTAIPFAS